MFQPNFHNWEEYQLWQEKKNTRRFFAYFIVLVLSITFWGCVFMSCAHADCQDPNTLNPQLKKAYYELQKASKELGGFSVSIKCYEK